MRLVGILAMSSLALAAPPYAAATEGEAATEASAPAEPAPAEAPPAPEISTDPKDGKAALDGYAHPGAMVGRPLVNDTPLMVEARKRAPKDLWNEMGLIQDEMKLYADEGRYDSLVDLTDRWVADMMGAFAQVYEGTIVPRQVGLKRAVLSCASASTEMRRAVDFGQPEPIERTVGFVVGCNRLFARFLPPEVTGLPDEFANYQEPPATAPEAAKP